MRYIVTAPNIRLVYKIWGSLGFHFGWEFLYLISCSRLPKKECYTELNGKFPYCIWTRLPNTTIDNQREILVFNPNLIKRHLKLIFHKSTQILGNEVKLISLYTTVLQNYITYDKGTAAALDLHTSNIWNKKFWAKFLQTRNTYKL